jgi:hypothetical protein
MFRRHRGVRKAKGIAMNKKLLSLCVTGMLLVAAPAFAQRDAGSKIRGETNFYGNSAGSAMRSARDYSNNYREYVPSAEKVNPDVAKEASDSIGTYIKQAKRHFAAMRKSAETGKDKETLTALDSIDKHLAAAAKSHDEMAETCLKATVDGKVSLECCKMIDDHLAKAIAEHDTLMKRLAASTTKK